ncbi:MAG: COG4705 family protein [Thermodesulfobacteriota bacterium]
MLSNNIKNRVPQIIFLYWVIKIASTTLGETGADMISMTFNIGYGATILIFMGIFLLLLKLKMNFKRYEPVTYWLTFTATAIAGTAISDYIDRTLGLGYAVGSLILIILLLILLTVWYLKEKSLSVENITTSSAEAFYWTAFLIANTLGTAAGDFVADNLGLGFMYSAILITGLLLLTVLMHYYTKISWVIIFWIAFVLTRPFGATFGDLLTKPIEKGGLNFGTIVASIFFAVILVISIIKEAKLERLRNAEP